MTCALQVSRSTAVCHWLRRVTLAKVALWKEDAALAARSAIRWPAA